MPSVPKGRHELGGEIRGGNLACLQVRRSAQGGVTMNCCLCGKDAGEYGHNAQPIRDGRCCDACNDTEVVPVRIKMVKRMFSGLE